MSLPILTLGEHISSFKVPWRSVRLSRLEFAAPHLRHRAITLPLDPPIVHVKPTPHALLRRPRRATNRTDKMCQMTRRNERRLPPVDPSLEINSKEKHMSNPNQGNQNQQQQGGQQDQGGQQGGQNKPGQGGQQQGGQNKPGQQGGQQR
jgi:hypothetical protein